MLLVKTEKARDALAERRRLPPVQRQFLLLCDGRRTEQALRELLGAHVQRTIDTLVDNGLLMRLSPTVSQVLPFSSTGTVLLTEQPGPGNAPAAGGVASPGADSAPAPRAHRRSLASSKMYMVNMLQLLRQAEAVTLAVALHTCDTGEELVESLLDGLSYIQAQASPTYAQRVLTQLVNLMPHEHLPRLLEGALMEKIEGASRLTLDSLTETDSVL